MTCWQGGDWKTLRSAIEKVGGKVTAKQLGVSDEKIISALIDATESDLKDKWPNFYSILHEKPLNSESAAFLAK
jgi:glycerol dehydrogenase-like iron-containing ADH family enzyme